MAKSKLVEANEKIAEKVVGGYKAIENGVVGGYKAIENGVVGVYTKIEDKFVDQFLTKDGETVEDAKTRLKSPKADNQSFTCALSYLVVRISEYDTYIR